MTDEAPKATQGKQPMFRLVPGLSAKLLLLTIIFVMLAEVLVFVPSVSNFRKQWLMQRLSAAHIASLAAEAAHLAAGQENRPGNSMVRSAAPILRRGATELGKGPQ